MTPVQLAEHGWHLVPWANRSAPVRKPMISGFLENKPNAKSVAGWMKTWPTCDWAIVPIDHAVIDIEMKNGLNGEAEWAELTADKEPVIGPSYTTFNNGRHLWFKLPAGCTLKGGVHLTPGIEIKCRNGTAHIAPSGGYAAIKSLGAYDDVPEMPAWLVALWANAKATTAARRTNGEMFADGERHAGLCSMASGLRNLGMGANEMFAALQGVRAARCENPETISDDELRGIADSYATKDADSFDLRVMQGEPTALSVLAFCSRKVEVIERDKPVEQGLPVLDGKHLRPTPLIAAWMDWVMNNSERKQPELALLSACVGLGCLIGRNLTWKHAHANLYGMGLASSASGKNTPLQSINKVLSLAGFGDLVASSDFGSDVGMLEEIANKPELIWVIDEFAIFLENDGKANCPGYIRNISKNLLQLSSCDRYRGKALKGKPSVEIAEPFPCVMTFAQPDMFKRVYNDRMCDSGFIGRFVVFLGETLPAKNYDATRESPPKALIDTLVSARPPMNPLADALSTVNHMITPRVPQEIASSAEVRAYHRSVDEPLENRMQALKHTEPKVATLMGRTCEKANKFSLIHAWSLNPKNPVMTKESIDWGYAVMEYSNACLTYMATTRATTPHEEGLDYIYECICKAEYAGVSRSKLAGTARRYDAIKRDLMLKDLIDSGRVVSGKVKQKHGPASTVLTADKYVRKESE